MDKRKIVLTQRFVKKLKKADDRKFKQISAAIAKFQNGEDETLRIHKLKGEYKNFWSFDAAYDLRIIYFLSQDGAIIIHNLDDLGTHQELYAN